MSAIHTIRARQTTRRYTNQPVDDDAIRVLLEAAIRAPSPHNRQPWRFAVVTGQARVRLAGAMGDRLRADLTRDGAAAEAIDQDVSRSVQRISAAPALILACLSMEDMDVYPDERRNALERWMAGQAVAAAIQNLLLAAAEMGVGACWMCAPLFCPDVVLSSLNLPCGWQPQALITLGYPAPGAVSRRERKAVDNVAIWLE